VVKAVASQLGLRLPPGHYARLFNCQRDIPAADLLLVMDKYTAADVLREVGARLGCQTLQLAARRGPAARRPGCSGHPRSQRCATPTGPPAGPRPLGPPTHIRPAHRSSSSSSPPPPLQVSSFDLINQSSHSRRVRRLGEFHPTLSRSKAQDGQDIDDPLYGNLGGSEEEQAVARAAVVIGVSCRGLVEVLLEVKAELGEGGEGKEGGGREEGASMASLLRQRVESMEAMDWLVPPLLRGGSMEFVLD
jgi:hypothetical protein